MESINSSKKLPRWYTKNTHLFMSSGYLNEGKDINETIYDIAEHAATILGKGSEFRDKLEQYIRNGWYIVPTPVWKNFNKYSKASPISCFGVVVDDTVESILTKAVEVGMQSKIGGGTSGSFHLIRPRGSHISGGGTTNGSIAMMEIFQTIAKIISQPNRRGHFSASLDIEHDDYDEFIGALRDEHPIQSISTAVTIKDSFIHKLLQKDKVALEKIRKLLKSRYETGYPYVFFHDNVNRSKPDIFIEKNYEITHSNMCTEITLPNSPELTFVCCLLGMNAELFDEWKDTDAVEVGVYFLDSMLTDFVNKLKEERIKNPAFYDLIYKPSVDFVEKFRAVGMGQSGLHSYMQSKSIAFHSLKGRMVSTLIQKTIQEQAYKASEKMALEYGRPSVFEGTNINRRHATLTAIAPNTSSSFIMGAQSQSIEPYITNYYVKDLVNIKVPIKNPYLESTLAAYGKNDEETWLSILKNNGSVQHLEFLSEHEKNVFKTFLEIPPDFIIETAAARQRFIDQSQSLNLMIGSDYDPDQLLATLLLAWKAGIKTLYYQLNVSQTQEFNRNNECVGCAG